MSQSLNKLIDIIEGAISDFQKKIPSIQARIFDDLQEQLQQLKTSKGKVLANVENLKIIGAIKNRLESIIMDDRYIDEVKKFILAFEQVGNFYNEHFASFNQKFKTPKTIPIIKQMSVDATINSLSEAGIISNIIEPIADILRTNITSGGSISELNNQLRNHITTNETGDGKLERYSKQITTDAINQYSANYNQAVAIDLKLEWYMYVGSNLTTTRPWCEAMTKLKYVHVSQLPKTLKGYVGDLKVPISEKTGLPGGMIPGTNVNNLTIYRGGYNCGHQLVSVDEVVIPGFIKAQVWASPEYLMWKKAA